MNTSKSLDLKEVKHLAQLSRIHLSEEEMQELSQDLGKIIEMVDKVSELNTDNLEPLYNIEANQDDTNVLRKDEVKTSPVTSVIGNNTDHFDSGHFVVPQVIE